MAEAAGPTVPPEWGPVQTALEEGCQEGVCTAAALMVGRPGRVLFQGWAGRLSDQLGAGEVGPETVFDLASLTKPLATTLACLGLVQEGRLNLDRPLGEYQGLRPHLASHLTGLTPAHLLTHTSGLPAWEPFYKELAEVPFPKKTARLLDLLNRTELTYQPGKETIYSDLGFMLLQILIEEISGLSLAEMARWALFDPLGLNLGFMVLPDGPGPVRSLIAASEHCPWREKLLIGEVNDENAWALGGISGQAGLFGDAASVFWLASWVVDSLRGRAEPRLLSPVTSHLILTNPFPGQPRTLGFDRPAKENSSAGELFGPEAVGHLGFTGTSLWLDPDSGLIVVLLTNRTIFGRDNKKIRTFRPLIHNLIKDALGMSP